MASKTLDGSGEVCVCLMAKKKKENSTKKKATAQFSPCPSKLFDKFEKLSIQVRKNERMKEWERNWRLFERNLRICFAKNESFYCCEEWIKLQRDFKRALETEIISNLS